MCMALGNQMVTSKFVNTSLAMQNINSSILAVIFDICQFCTKMNYLTGSPWCKFCQRWLRLLVKSKSRFIRCWITSIRSQSAVNTDLRSCRQQIMIDSVSIMIGVKLHRHFSYKSCSLIGINWTHALTGAKLWLIVIGSKIQLGSLTQGANYCRIDRNWQ